MSAGGTIMGGRSTKVVGKYGIIVIFQQSQTDVSRYWRSVHKDNGPRF